MNKMRNFFRFLLTNKYVDKIGNIITGLTLNKVDDFLWRARKALIQKDTATFEKELNNALVEGKKAVAEKVEAEVKKQKRKVFLRLLGKK